MLRQMSGLVGIYGIFVVLCSLVFIYKNATVKTVMETQYKKHRLVLFILDGFRHDYVDKLEFKHLRKMISQGVRVKKVMSVFPSLTMTNHQSMLTGLYAPYHGIIANEFNDSSMNYAQFQITNQATLNDPKWYENYPIPIWVSCEKSGFCKSGSMCWPNTDAPIEGFLPFRRVNQYYSLTFPPNIYPYDRRINELVDWMTNDFIDFGLIYFENPDEVSHKYGPFHAETVKVLHELDGKVGEFLEKLEKANILSETDVIVTSDHGMTELSDDRVINLDKYVAPELYKAVSTYPVGLIYPNKGQEDNVFNLLKNISQHLKVYKREDVPADLHYSDNKNRISPIVIVVDHGYFVNSSNTPGKLTLKGMHGYDPNKDDMHATMIAMGPSFKKSVVIEKSKNVDLYPLMMHLLGLKANPNNGSLESLLPLLRSTAVPFQPLEDRYKFHSYTIFVYSLLLAHILLLLFFLRSICSYLVEQRRTRRVIKP